MRKITKLDDYVLNIGNNSVLTINVNFIDGEQKGMTLIERRVSQGIEVAQAIVNTFGVSLYGMYLDHENDFYIIYAPYNKNLIAFLREDSIWREDSSGEVIKFTNRLTRIIIEICLDS